MDLSELARLVLKTGHVAGDKSRLCRVRGQGPGKHLACLLVDVTYADPPAPGGVLPGQGPAQSGGAAGDKNTLVHESMPPSQVMQLPVVKEEASDAR